MRAHGAAFSFVPVGLATALMAFAGGAPLYGSSAGSAAPAIAAADPVLDL